MTATQLYFGPREADAFPLSAVESAVRAARETGGMDAIMVWPCADEAVMARIIQACHDSRIEPYLWFPVLADALGLPADQEELVIGSDGARGNGRIGAWEGLDTGEEKFLFACPNNDNYADRVFGLYSSLLDRLDVSGVMLDRIRFPSPANGFEALFTCFCPACRERFQRETGRSLSLLADRAQAFCERPHRLTADSFSSEWRASDTLWTVSGLEELSAFRTRSVARMVEKFSREAQRRGLKVGLDLFSPSLAGIVSQDYRALSGMCHWIKAMIYCHARGPAGLPLESECLRRALRELSAGLTEQEALQMVSRALRMDVPATGSFPLDTISRELDVVRGMNLPQTMQVLAGIEAVSIPHFGIDVREDALREAISRAHGRCHGLVASWNLLHIPDANLRLIGALKR